MCCFLLLLFFYFLLLLMFFFFFIFFFFFGGVFSCIQRHIPSSREAVTTPNDSIARSELEVHGGIYKE